ncbi:hypothetical protein GW746_01055 [Candidatus Saccharibacteria bacterium]|nr:hypothetical protein [Candidatus Saccharibacteria bacterium]NCS82990.1 hypothetical protein [Candidatus Saccharibacteria bacterium]
MKEVTKKTVVGFVAAFALLAGSLFIPTGVVQAQNCDAQGGAADGINCAQGDGVPTTLFGDDSIFKTIVNTLLYIIGAISVIMLIYGGIRYTTSGGNSTNVSAAKNTIMYAIIGLIVAFLAFALVNWVLGIFIVT